MQKIIFTTKTIGVVIPIYNVEKYLKECLDSVINQTYTNLEIILVNDGSTDENSLNIAKEYTLKDKRITLFDKKNGGQSTARNVGIEYFSGEYKLKNKTQTIKENSLIEFNIEGNNPYEIYTVYKSYKAFNNEQDLTSFTYPIIDYIIFLDSDDYWELNCIEECVPRMDGVDVVWFDVKTVLDGVNHSDWKSNIKWLNLSRECILGRDDWLRIMYEAKMRWFYFAVMGMINFNFLKNIRLKFIDYIVQEDDHFGILLFSQMKYCYILPKELYFYRIRPNSTMAYQAKVTAKNIPMFFKENLDYFDNDAILTREYFHVSSHVITCINMINFFDKKNDDILTKSLLKYLLPAYIKNAYEIVHFSKDPLGLLSNVEAIKNLMDKYGIKPHGVEFRFKNELPYAIGSIILQNCKSFKKICKLPRQIYKILKQNKINQKLFKARIVEHPYTILPHLYEYEDVAKIDRLKEHLSFKIGLAFLKGHKYRYIGGYFVFLFKVAKLSINHYNKLKQNKTKSEYSVFRANVEQGLANINYELYRLRLFEEEHHKKFIENEILDFKNIIDFDKISFSIQNDFSKIFYKKSIFIDMTNNYLKTYNYLNKFENIDIYAFEAKKINFFLVKKKRLKNLNIFDLSSKINIEYEKKYIYSNEMILNIKTIENYFYKLDFCKYDFHVLKIELNFDTFYFLKKIIEEKKMNFFYIIVSINNDFYKEIFYEEINILRNKNDKIIFNI